jgi:long-chain acyl-CoA synthetase
MSYSYLPLAHIYERNNMTTVVHVGGSVGFYSGNVQELLDDVLVSGLDSGGKVFDRKAGQWQDCKLPQAALCCEKRL